ncbi:MAG: pseudouridylate synthase [Calditrichaeota bacterium]|nr:pseudouridylate synthase [Calditrichota bacterium]
MSRAPFPILYEDELLIAIHKPPGLHVHRNAQSGREPTVLPLLRDQLGYRLYTVHRLDRATSGVLLFGKSSEGAALMAGLFRERRIAKRYLAVVRGYLTGEGVVDKPLREFKGDEEMPALTRFRGLATVELPMAVGNFPTARYSLVAAFPETGRRQQIRRHLAHLAHPIIGDTQKGDGDHNRLFRSEFDLHRLLLMATELAFEHPLSGRKLRIRAPVHRQVARLLTRFDWANAVEAWELP